MVKKRRNKDNQNCLETQKAYERICKALSSFGQFEKEFKRWEENFPIFTELEKTNVLYGPSKNRPF